MKHNFHVLDTLRTFVVGLKINLSALFLWFKAKANLKGKLFMIIDRKKSIFWFNTSKYNLKVTLILAKKFLWRAVYSSSSGKEINGTSRKWKNGSLFFSLNFFTFQKWLYFITLSMLIKRLKLNILLYSPGRSNLWYR